MTKQEKIIEAWGNDWVKLDDKAKDLLLNYNQGALVLRDFTRLISRDIDDNIYLYEKGVFNSYVIPKSLQGIENNNGWIKIESEADLPREDYGNCYIIQNSCFDKIIYGGFRRYSNDLFFFFKKNGQSLKYKSVSHYQPIVKPKPPVY